MTSATYCTSTMILSWSIFTAALCDCKWLCTRTRSAFRTRALQSKENIQLVPACPPFDVQSTAIRSASPVSTVNGASMNTLLLWPPRISIVGSYALRGRGWVLLSELALNAAEGCRRRRRGVALWRRNFSSIMRSIEKAKSRQTDLFVQRNVFLCGPGGNRVPPNEL